MGGLGDGFCAVTRDIRDGNTFLASSLEIHNVRAGGEDADVFEFGKVLNVLAREDSFGGENDFGIGGATNDFGSRSAVVNLARAKRFEVVPIQIAGI